MRLILRSYLSSKDEAADWCWCRTCAVAGVTLRERVIDFLYVFREYMNVSSLPHVQHIDVVAIHRVCWDIVALSCFLITVCSSLPGLSVVSMSHGCMTALELCTTTIMEQSTSLCIYDSIKKLHKDKGVGCYHSSLSPSFLHSSQSLAPIYVTTHWWEVDKWMVNIEESRDICMQHRGFLPFVILRWLM